MKEKTRDIISSLALIALSLFGLYLAFDIPEKAAEKASTILSSVSGWAQKQ